MAVDVTVPATLSYTGGALRDTRPVPARFSYTASTSLFSSKDSDTSAAITELELDRLFPLDQLLNKDGTPSLRLMSIWQTQCEQIEAAIAAVNAKVDDNTAILARLTAAEALAQAANDNAVVAQTTAAAIQTAASETFGIIDPIYQVDFDDRL